jgi:hypothetical protein
LGGLLELKKRFGRHSFNPVFIGPQMVFQFIRLPILLLRA